MTPATLLLDGLAFHFLRPAWLLLVPLAIVVPIVWRRGSDPVEQWKRLIAPHLLDALLVGEHGRFHVRPIHLVAATLALAGIAVAGPTWEKEPPPFTQDTAPMVVAIDLSRSMDATDVPPTRLERIKQKVRDLAKLRAGARTGLVVYAGTAHLVLPPSEDPELMQLFLDALSTDLMPSAGKNAAGALAEARTLLGREDAPGTILFFTDGFDVSQIPAFESANRGELQVLAIAAGTAQGGPLRAPDGSVVTDRDGRPVFGSFDRASLERLANEGHVPLTSLTLDASDMSWVQRRAQKHLRQVEDARSEQRWKEYGYWLCFPLALIALLGFRRGSSVRWAMGLLAVAALAAPSPARAASFRPIDLFLTHDQQGRWCFDHGEFAKAAERFDDPLWKGCAYSRAGDFLAALGEFSRLKTPRGYFEMGNAYARLGRYPQALQAYDLALKAEPGLEEAKINRKLVASLIPPESKDEEGEQAPDLPPDQVKYDNDQNRGKKTRTMGRRPAENADLWMRNLTLSPAAFLREKFRIQAAEGAREGRQDFR